MLIHAAFCPKINKAKLSPDAPYFTPSSAHASNLEETPFGSSGDFDEDQDTKEEIDSIEESDSKEDTSTEMVEEDLHPKISYSKHNDLKFLSPESENTSKETKASETPSKLKLPDETEEVKELRSSMTKLSLRSKIYKSQKHNECKKFGSAASLNLNSKNFTPSQTADKVLCLPTQWETWT